MKKILFFLVFLLNACLYLSAQNVGIGTTTPNSSALLDVSSTTKGILLPRLSTDQRNTIVNPAVGLTIFNTDDQCTDIYDGSNWIKNCGLKQTGTVTVPADTWLKKTDFGGIARQYAVGFSIGNKGYVGTGLVQGNTLSKDFWEYDPVTNSWQQKADFGGVARQNAVGFSIGSKGYIGTGRNPAYLKDFWEYDPTANNWSQKTDFGGTARAYAVGISISTKGYIGTGYNGIYNNDFWEYDPTTNAWTQKTNFAGAGLASATGFSLNNKGYIGTGFSPGDNAEALDFWEYTPGTNSWVPKANLAITGSQARQAAVGFSIGTKGYIGTGLRNTMLKNFFEYDPVANAWTQKADFGGSARYYAVGFSIGTKGYIGTGGTGGSTYLKDFWEYNQASYSTPSYSSLSPAISNTEITDGIWTKTILNEIISTGGNIKISQNGNLGIGTSAPGFPLNFPNTLSDKISLYGNSGSHYGFGIQGGLLQIYTDAAPSSIAFGYGSSDAFTETMRIRGDGNVGIGTTTPGSMLDINGQLTIDQKNFGGYGGLLLKGNIPGSNYPNIAFSIKNTAAADVVAAIVQGDLQNNTAGAESIDLTFSTSQSGFGSLSEKLRIKGNGNIGIGNSNPIRPLSFPPALGEKILLYPGGSGEVGIGVYGNELRLHADNPGAAVSFGTQDNAGTFTQAGRFQIGSGYALYVNGSIWANGTTYTSDERFKQNITAISSPLQKLLQINGVEYEMKVDEFSKNYFMPGRQIGLLAQNVEKIIPGAVNEKDGFKGVDYARLVPLLIESIKELNKKIETQQMQINSLLKTIPK